MTMTRRWMLVVAAIAGVAVAGAALIVTNPAPDVPVLSRAELAGPPRPFVIKLHARWCPVCMVTRDAWSTLRETYDGRVRFVVFDFTTAATTDASRAEAGRLGLDAVFEQYSGETGTVLVLEGGSKAVKHALHGTRDDAVYRAAVDGVLGMHE
jgi:hypothetical protein